MNINPSAAASVAGTSRAAARGGESENQSAEATKQQAKSDAPGGKGGDTAAVDAGDHADDRYGDGRQTLDTFERSDSEEKPEETKEQAETPTAPLSTDEPESGGHLDLQA